MSSNGSLPPLPEPIYDPFLDLTAAECKHIRSWVMFRENKDGTRTRLTRDTEILEWIAGRRLRVISIGKALMARLNDIYWYHDGTYEICNSRIEQWVRQNAKKFDFYLPGFSTALRSTIVEEFVNLLKQTYLTDREEIEKNEEEYIAFKNGLLPLSRFREEGSLELEAFNPEIKLMRRVPHELLVKRGTYEPGLEKVVCPRFLQHFRDTVNEEWVPLQFEVIGFCLIPGYPIHKFFVLHGPHDTAKGTFSHILQCVLGHENVTAKTFDQLAEQQFELQHLHRKFANIGDEMPRGVKQYVETIKAITGESLIEAPKKHSNEHFHFWNEAKCFFIGNELPRVGEAGDAFWDRVEVIPYPHRFKENKTYEETLLGDEKEISGLLYCSLAAVQRALKRGDFSVPVSAIKEEWRRESDTVRAFVQESLEGGKLVLDKDAEIRENELYWEFQSYRGDSKQIASPKTFTRRLREQFGIVTRQVMVRNVRDRYYVGVGHPKSPEPSEAKATLPTTSSVVN